MNVILLKDVEKLGLKGEVVDVTRGYARNFLLPRKLAEVATAGRVAEVKQIEAQQATHEARSADQAAEIAATLGKTVLRFDVKAGPTGSLFGSVTTTDIADEIWRTRKIRVDRRKIGDRPHQADRPLHGADRRLRGRLRRDQAARRARGWGAPARGGARGDGGGRGCGRRSRCRRGRTGVEAVERGGGRRGRSATGRRGRGRRRGRRRRGVVVEEPTRPSPLDGGRRRGVGRRPCAPGGFPSGSPGDGSLPHDPQTPVDGRPDFPLGAEIRGGQSRPSGEKSSAPGDRIGTPVPFSLHLPASCRACPVPSGQVDWRRDHRSRICPVGAIVPPQNLEAEESVLGAMLLSATAIGAVTEILDAGRLLPRVARDDLPGRTRALREGRARRRDHARRTSSTSAASSSASAARQDRRARSGRPGDLERRALRADRQGDGDAARPRRVGQEIQRLGQTRPGETTELVDRAEQMVFELAQERVTGEFAHIKELLKEASRGSARCTRPAPTSPASRSTSTTSTLTRAPAAAT